MGGSKLFDITVEFEVDMKFFGDDLGEAGADFVGVGLGGGLGHHAHERFGAGGAQQHTAGVSQQFLLTGHGILDALVGGGGLLVHVRHEGLRQLREVGGELLQALARTAQGQGAVAGGGEFAVERSRQ